jgi:hypothetical protein
MYFQKPADALTAVGGPGSSGGEVAQLNEPARGVAPLPVPDVPAATLPPPPPPPASRYLPAPAERPAPNPALAVPHANTNPTLYQPEPGKGDIPPTTVQKKDVKLIPVDPKYIRLPPREDIFTVYDDAQLEKAIMDRLRQDLLEQYIRQFENEKKRKPTPEEQKAYMENQERYFVFPPLPVISPPNVPYQPKTVAYEPRKLLVEPGYVVHRRLHFEEKNGERAGWDLGPFSTLVAATDFCRNALLWPQSLASGCVHGFWDTSAGKCLPGSPTPYYLYPPGLTLTGSVFEAGAVIGTLGVFP